MSTKNTQYVVKAPFAEGTISHGARTFTVHNHIVNIAADDRAVPELRRLWGLVVEEVTRTRGKAEAPHETDSTDTA